MWQDRRPNPPSPASRSGTSSPLPRRPTNPGPGPLPPRPGVNPRSSSLSLASTPSASVTNVASTLRTTNASSLRHELRADAVPQHSVDPLRALEQILGTSLEKEPSRNALTEENAPEGLDEPIDFQGLSLQEFVARSSRTPKGSTVHSSTRTQSEQCTFPPVCESM